MVERTDKDIVDQVVHQFYAQKAPKRYVFVTPCHKVGLELKHGSGAFYVCPKRGCGKRYYVDNNMINKRLYVE